MGLTGNIVCTADLMRERCDEMFALMQRYYENVRREEFDQDLHEKDWVIEVSRPSDGALCGFSTQMAFDLPLADRTVRGLFSGDTIVDPQYWSNNPLAGLWGNLVLALVERSPWEELCWFLICKGYKTYRFLPTFFEEYYPRHDRPTPDWASARLQAFSDMKFPERYDAARGIIRAAIDSARLREGVAQVTPQRLRNADVRFFCERNPGHAQGDELCCVAPLSRDNFTAAAWRVISATRHLIPGTVPFESPASSSDAMHEAILTQRREDAKTRKEESKCIPQLPPWDFASKTYR